MASEPAQTRLLRAILYLVLSVTFGHTINAVYRSPALTFSATIHFAVKRSASCSAVLRHSPSSWAAVVHWSALDTGSSEVVQETPHPLSPPSPHHAGRAPHQFYELAPFVSLVSSIHVIATNPANRIRLLRIIASMCSPPVFVSVSK